MTVKHITVFIIYILYLNNHSYYSLRYGTISENELLKIAKELGCTTFALTDINNTSGCMNFVRNAQKKDIKPVLGVDFRNGTHQLYICIARNNEGFQEINTHLSKHLSSKIDFDEIAPIFSDVIVIYPFEQVLRLDKSTFRDNEYIGVRVQDLGKFRFSSYIHLTNKLVLLHTTSFRNKKDFNVHRLLRSIDTNVLLSRLPDEEQGKLFHSIVTKDYLQDAFQEYPHIIYNTETLLEECSIAFKFSDKRINQNLKTVFSSDTEDYRVLRDLCIKGLPDRYEEITYTIKRRVVKELLMIRSQEYVSFFLINWKIVNYARSKGFYHIGRGSGANSIVAYLLHITDVDPIELDLYFERFMNIYRASPPDFDIDFSTWDREDVTQYIFDEFGKEYHAALLGSYVTFKHSGAVRELGKVFGLPKHEIDKLSDGRYTLSALDEISQLVIKYAQILHGKPNYISIHAAGILISERSIHYFSATNLPPKGFPTVQFDMHIAEDVGLYKFDILGQRGLGKIKDAVTIVQENHPDVKLKNIHNARQFFKDDHINKMISRAQCIGCFYVESPAMRMLLKKLEVSDYLTLVAASSIIRPGVAKSGMMREYILRHRNPERRKEAHPILWDIMPDTYGVMVYQEDVIKVAQHYAKLDLGEADVLRRGMSGKYRSREEFLAVKEKFISNCIAQGEKETVVLEVWRQIESFAGYAFAKGHSASYAVESYQSLYLKCYYPLEYMVATVNNGGGFYRVETYLHEARMHGGTVHPPCINTSDIKTIIRGKDIYLGFQHLDNLERRTMLKIVEERDLSGPFDTLDNFIKRVRVGIQQLDILIRIDAFRSTKKDKRSLLWEAYYKDNSQPKERSQTQMFQVAIKEYALPDFEIPVLESAFDQLELLGFPLFDPFILLKHPPTSDMQISDIKHHLNKVICIYGYLVTAKNTSTSKGDRMSFGTFLDRAGAWIDTVHFPQVSKRFPFTGKGIYRITGKVVEEFGFYTIEVTRLERLPYVSDPRFDATYNRKIDDSVRTKPFRLLR